MKKWKKTRRQKLRKNGKLKSKITIYKNDLDEEIYNWIKEKAHESEMSITNYLSSIIGEACDILMEKEKSDRRRRRLLQEMTDMDQELGIY